MELAKELRNWGNDYLQHGTLEEIKLKLNYDDNSCKRWINQIKT